MMDDRSAFSRFGPTALAIIAGLVIIGLQALPAASALWRWVVG